MRNELSCWAIKNSNSTFIDMSEPTALLLGWKKASLAVGKNEYEIPCKIAEHAEMNCRSDQEVITKNKALISFYIGNYATGCAILLGEKKPIKLNDSEELGVHIHTIDVSNAYPGLFSLFDSDNKILNLIQSRHEYILNENPLSSSLTKRQQECLFLLVRGKTNKQIAKILNIAPRTVEDHIVKIKHSLNCNTKSQLIEKAINSGFVLCLPQIFCSNLLDKIINC